MICFRIVKLFKPTLYGLKEDSFPLIAASTTAFFIASSDAFNCCMVWSAILNAEQITRATMVIENTFFLNILLGLSWSILKKKLLKNGMSYNFTNSTRLLLALPSSVELSAIGFVFPYPLLVNFEASIPIEISWAFTASARCCESFRL